MRSNGINGSENGASGTSPQLPSLLRPPHPRLQRFRDEYPHAAIHHWKNASPNEDPYQNFIVWAKLTGHPYWPSRLATEEERESLWTQKTPELFPFQQTLDPEAKNLGSNDNLLVYFFGSRQLGIVRRSSLEPYLPRFGEFANKCKEAKFQQGLEEADGDVMRAHFGNGTGFCMVCGGTDQPNKIILCDRCNSEAHFYCLKPALLDVPAGEWMCPICEIEAPRTKDALNAEWARRENLKAEGKEEKVIKKRGVKDNGNYWTLPEDQLLADSIPKAKSWAQLGSLIPGRTVSGCKNRVSHLVKKGWKIDYKHLTLNAEERGAKVGRPRLSDEEKARLAFNRGRAAAAAAAASIANQSLSNHSPSPINSSSAGLETTTSTTTTSHQGPGRPKRAAAVTANATLTSSHEKKKGKPGPKKHSSKPVSQLGEMLSEISRMSTSVPQTCFVCNRTGADIECSDDNCERSYHSFCLGIHSIDSEWYCPWHYCAVCPRKETPEVLLGHHSQVITPLFQIVDYCQWNKKSEGKTQVVVEVEEGNQDLSSPDVIEVGEEESSSSRKKRKTSPSKKDDQEETGLFRCSGCPLALCHEHLNVSVLNQIPVLRATKNSCFACERCIGLQVNNEGEIQQLPNIPLARLLDRVLTDTYFRKEKLLGFFLHVPSHKLVETVAGSFSVDSYFALYRDTPKSILELQLKIRLLKYHTRNDFMKDCTKLGDSVFALYERSHPRLAEVAKTFSIEVDAAFKLLEKDVFFAEKQLPIALKTFESCLSNSKLEPSLLGLTPWESLTRVPCSETDDAEEVQEDLARWMETVRAEKDKRFDGKSTLALLVQALEAAKLMPNIDDAEVLLTPSREQLENLFDSHSANLRASLRTAAELRYQVNRVLNVVDGLSSENFDLFEPVLTIGGNRPEAEHAAANRALRAKLDESVAALKMEKEARKNLEARLQMLENKLQDS